MGEWISGPGIGQRARAHCDQPRNPWCCGGVGEDRDFEAASGAEPLPRRRIVDSPFPRQFSGRFRRAIVSSLAAMLFWSAIALIVYVFAGYPLLLTLWGVLRPRPWRREPSEPMISIVMAAHNEAASILSKIKNLLALDYPSDRMEILIGSDGSTDGTVEAL